MTKDKNVNDLQQLVEAAGEGTTLEWSTISHTHGGAALAGGVVPNGEVGAFNINQLQQLIEAAGEATTLEWSTVSHTHKAK